MLLGQIFYCLRHLFVGTWGYLFILCPDILGDQIFIPLAIDKVFEDLGLDSILIELEGEGIAIGVVDDREYDG